MRNWKAFAFAAVASTLLAGSLQAQTGTGSLLWIGANVSGAYGTFSRVSAGGQYQATVFTNSYRAQLNVASGPSSMLPPSGSPWGPTVDIFCVDWFHDAGSMTVNFTNLGDANVQSYLSSGKTRDNSLTKYLATAYLAEQITLTGANTDAGKNMSAAIWQIMTGDAFFRWTGSAWDGSSIQTYYNTAMDVNNLNGGWHTVNASNWVVVTPTDLSTDRQEFITHATPEPATLLLLGTGLLATLMAAGALKRSAV